MPTASKQTTGLPERLVRLLVCPHCGESLRQDREALRCENCPRLFPVIDGIPRFVPSESYADSFGFQWNRYRTRQLDSANGTGISARRFFAETGLDVAWLRDKIVLDAGCGAGRFAEIAARHAKHVVAVDISSAVDATRRNLLERPNVDVVQGSIAALPFRPEAFDAVYCIGVLQHTPDPRGAAAGLPGVLKPGGRLAITAYERKRRTKFSGKYMVRPLTRRMSPQALARAITLSMPVLFPLAEILFRLPFLGRAFRFALPIANYAGMLPLTMRQRYEWAVLDTFDMLSPAYDDPLTEAELRSALQPTINNLRRLTNPGLNLVGVQRADPAPAFLAGQFDGTVAT